MTSFNRSIACISQSKGFLPFQSILSYTQSAIKLKLQETEQTYHTFVKEHQQQGVIFIKNLNAVDHAFCVMLISMGHVYSFLKGIT